MSGYTVVGGGVHGVRGGGCPEKGILGEGDFMSGYTVDGGSAHGVRGRGCPKKVIFRAGIRGNVGCVLGSCNQCWGISHRALPEL